MLSLIIGFLSSIVPGLMKIVGDIGDKKHELELMKLQLEYADKQAVKALDAQILNAEAQTITAIQNTDATNLKHTHKFVNDINGLIRPLGAVFAFGVLGFVIYHTVFGDKNLAMTVLSVPIIVDTVGFIIGYWFGNRSVGKMIK